MKKPLARRILMTTDAVGGVWVYATELARALCSEGAEVTLVVMGPAPRAEQLQPLHHVPGLDIEVTDLALEWMDPQGSDAAHARESLLQIARRAEPDLVHLNSYREAVFDWTSPLLVVAHSCVMSWWQECRGGTPDDDRWRNYAAAVAAGLRAADAWVAPTTAMRAMIEASHSPPTRGVVIWNGINPHSGRSPKQPFILAAGRLWDEAKNLANLSMIAPALDWPVRVAGPLQDPGLPLAQTSTAGIECLGVLPRAALGGVMREAAIFVAPALYEPFGLTVLEAAASGCALVLSDIPSFRELWHGAALFVDPHDRHALLATIQRLSRDPELRIQAQQAAARRASRYLLDSMVSAYFDLYEAILSSALPAPTQSRATSELHA